MTTGATYTMPSAAASLNAAAAQISKARPSNGHRSTVATRFHNTSSPTSSVHAAASAGRSLNSARWSNRGLHTPSARATGLMPRSGLLRAVRLDMLGKAGDRSENALVVGIIGAELNAVLLGDGERKLEQINRVQTQAVAVQADLRISLFGRHIHIQRLDHPCCMFRLYRRLRAHTTSVICNAAGRVTGEGRQV